MIIVVNDSDEITQLITVGSSPVDQVSYEVDHIPQDIRSHLGDYKYINGQFVLKLDAEDEHINQAKTAKIEFLSATCQQIIESGVDFNGSHYSLTYADQINLSKLATTAAMAPNMPIFYHADGELCRQYSADEILQLSQIAVAWVSYHTTYFNYAKAFINSLNSFDEIALFKYGMKLDGEFQIKMTEITAQFGVTFDQQIDDPLDYNLILYPSRGFFTNPNFGGIIPV